MKLDPNWRQSWRWLSVHAMALAIAVQAAWLAVPQELRSLMPAWVGYAVTVILLVAGILGRLVDQSAKPDPTDQAGA